MKYLGLNFDDQLSGEAIVNSIVQKVSGRLKFLYRQCSFLKEKLSLRKSIMNMLGTYSMSLGLCMLILVLRFE